MPACLRPVRCRATIPHAADQTIADVQITRYRPGFYLADGAGVGKGRQIAALIAEHWRTGGRRILWLSVSNDLKVGLQPSPPLELPVLLRH